MYRPGVSLAGCLHMKVQLIYNVKGEFFLTLENIRQVNRKNTLVFWDRLARIIFTVKFIWRKYEQNRRTLLPFIYLLFTFFVHCRYQSLASCRHYKYCIFFQNSPVSTLSMVFFLKWKFLIDIMEPKLRILIHVTCVFAVLRRVTLPLSHKSFSAKSTVLQICMW